MDRYEAVVKVEEVIKYAQSRQYDKACEILETINTTKIKNYDDLIIFAEVYLKNKKYREAKEILERIHERTSTRRLIALLISVNAKMHNYVEAEKYYEEYTKIAPKDVNRFILRYKIDKAKGLGYDELIKSLEQLKEYDLVEEWEYELAKLYHKAGYEDKCVSECNTIIMMFGAGVIVEKAKLLRDHHLDAISKNSAYSITGKSGADSGFNATMQLNDIIDQVKEKMSDDRKDITAKSSDEEDYGEDISVSPKIEEEYAKDNDKIKDAFFDKEEINEDAGYEQHTEADAENVQEVEQEVEQENYERPDEDDEVDDDFINNLSSLVNSELDKIFEQTKKEAKNQVEEPVVSEYDRVFSKAIVDDSDAGILDRPLIKKAVREYDEKLPEEEIAGNSIDEPADEAEDEPEDMAVQESEYESEDAAEDIDDEAVEENAQEQPKEKPEEKTEDDIDEKVDEENKKIIEPDYNNSGIDNDYQLDEEEYNHVMKWLSMLLSPMMYDDSNTDDIDEKVFRNYYSIPSLRANIRCTLRSLAENTTKSNYIICGSPKSGKTTIAKMIAKTAYTKDIIDTSKVARIDAEKFNDVDLEHKQDKLADGCLIIQRAHLLTPASMTSLITMIVHLNGRIIVFLETEYDYVAKLYIMTREVREYFTNVVSTPEYSQKELMGFAKSYAAYKGYSFSDSGTFAMEELIDSTYNRLKVSQRIPYVLTSVEKAIRASQSRSQGGFGRPNYDGLNVLEMQDVEQQYQ